MKKTILLLAVAALAAGCQKSNNAYETSETNAVETTYNTNSTYQGGMENTNSMNSMTNETNMNGMEMTNETNSTMTNQ